MKLKQAEYRALLRSTFRLHLKLEPSCKGDIQRIFFRGTAFHAAQMMMLAELFPNFKLIFNTRHPVASLRSFLQVEDTVQATLYWKLGMFWRRQICSKHCYLLEEEFTKHLAPFSRYYMNMSFSEWFIRRFSVCVKT